MLILTEHWLKCHELVSVTLNNYDLISKYCRPTIPRGGSCIYVRAGIKVINKQDYCDLSQEQIFDVCAVQLVKENILIIGIYHSNQTDDYAYLHLFEKLLNKISNECSDSIIMGDININMLINNKLKKQLKDILSRHNFSQLIKSATRVDGDTATLLDHVYTNLPEERVTAVSGVASNLSDHDAQRLSISCANAASPPHFKERRSLSAADKLNFGNALESVDWTLMVERSKGDCHAFAESITTIIGNTFNTCFPIKKQLSTSKKIKWVDSEVRNMKSLLYDTLNLKKAFPGNIKLINIAENYAKKYNSLIKEKRTNYYSKMIGDHPNKSKCMWNVISTELGRKSSERADYTDLVRNTDGAPFRTKRELLDALNLEFTTAASKCGAPAADIGFAHAALSADSSACDVSLRLELFSPDEIVLIVNKYIAAKNSTDLYGISSNLLRTIAKSIAIVIAHLFNICIRAGIYPEPLKRVKISPLYKGKGKKSEIKSYRPISLVPALSKILKIVSTQRS